MGVTELFNAEKSLSGLMSQTVVLLRQSQQVTTIKRYLHCYDILDITNQINEPWADHPGYVYGDLGAFVDLEITCKDIILSLDPDPKLVKHYVLDVTRFLIFWKKANDNKVQNKKYSPFR